MAVTDSNEGLVYNLNIIIKEMAIESYERRLNGHNERYDPDEESPDNVLKRLDDELYKDLLNAQDRITKSKAYLRQLRNKRVVLVVGGAGVGKSTIASALAMGT